MTATGGAAARATHPAPPGVALPYRFRPARTAARAPAPLLVLLHGVGGDEHSLATLADRLPGHLHVALPRAPLAGPQGGHAWYGVQVSEEGARANALEAEAARVQVLQFLDQLQQVQPYDAQQVCVAGFGQGAVIAASVGLTRPDRVAAIGMLCGRILPQVKWQLAPGEQLSRLHVFFAEGGADGITATDYAEDAMRTMAEHGVEVAYRDYPGRPRLHEAMANDFVQWVAQHWPAPAR
ncbi:phospholipase [Caldimonas thermodepolymerans]|jgi:phospholipase/carboxylesterase|nr:phospholipase [Caldimonas thermodepolymerans]QPC30594.1 phospholipase [Caldimonas thermodepolymerans]RDI02805.1 phospholipase/carboxylesterase [Caldimonas thermodepolymerans]UZG43324.1 phospholipase [Caldimonas thermodepolymerans]